MTDPYQTPAAMLTTIRAARTYLTPLTPRQLNDVNTLRIAAESGLISNAAIRSRTRLQQDLYHQARGSWNDQWAPTGA